VGGAVGAGVAITLLVAVALAVFAHPNGDDFCVAADEQEVGVFGCVRRSYELQGGRWAGYVVGCALEATAPLTDQYPIGPWLMLTCIVLAAWFLLVSVLPLQGNRRLAVSLTLTLVALYFAGTPEPGQTFYWLDGSVAYTLNLALSMVLVAGLARLPTGRSPARSAAVLALGILALVTAGFHELLALVLAVVLVTGACVAFVRRDPRRLAWVVACAGLLVGFVTVAVAPGNVLRERGVQSNVQPLGGALRETAEMWLRVLDTPVARGTNTGSYGRPLGWILDPKLLAATVLFATSARVRSLRPRWVPEEPGWKLVFPAAWLASLTGAFLGGGVVLGATLPPRVMNSLYLVFLLGWFLTVFVYTRFPVETGAVHPGERLLRPACAAILALGLLFSTNVKHGVRDLATGRAAAYDRVMTRRYEAARELRASGGEHLVVPAIEPWPSSYYQNDLQEDPQGVQNQCWARYFGLASIRRARVGEGDGHPSLSGSFE
jgi:hypothetical protein